ncbi:MAG: helix-turn-helix domain-containing protein [Solirubrobacterales bacterium]
MTAPLRRVSPDYAEQVRLEIAALSLPRIRRMIADNAIHLRESHGMTQQALADLTVMPRKTISRLERAAHEPRISTLVAFSFAMRVPLTAFLSGLPAMPPDDPQHL